MDRETANEVDLVKDRDEHYAQGRVEELIRLHLEVHSEELTNVQNRRAEERDIRQQELAQMQNDIMQKFRLGVLTMRVQRVAAETKNRKKVNTMIMDVKTHNEEITRFSNRALEVLDSTKEQYALLSPSRIAKTRSHLTQVGEQLRTISSSMNDIEAILVRYGLEDDVIGGICRQIKTDIWKFNGVISALKQDMPNGEIGFRNREDFKDHRKRLYQMINCMRLISEERISVVEAIEARHNETMPDVENLRIEN